MKFRIPVKGIRVPLAGFASLISGGYFSDEDRKPYKYTTCNKHADHFTTLAFNAGAKVRRISHEFPVRGKRFISILDEYRYARIISRESLLLQLVRQTHKELAEKKQAEN